MKTANRNNRVYPAESSEGLVNPLRRVFQNPRRILKPYILPGMTILDFGCGPGFFTIDIAKILNGSGKVIAADLQQEMLDKLKAKLAGSPFEKKIELHKCMTDKTGLTARADFVLAFYVIHEVPDQKILFEEFRSILKPGGRMLIVEPSFHVSANEFEEMIGRLLTRDFKVAARPKIIMSRSVVVERS
jgi:ubiquinone/menaquinone biosynthesis C-methylase UbiE